MINDNENLHEEKNEYLKFRSVVKTETRIVQDMGHFFQNLMKTPRR